MGMNKKRKKSGMSMDKGVKLAKSTKAGKMGKDMMSMDSMPMKSGGSVKGYSKGGSVSSCMPRGAGAARNSSCKIC